MIQRAIVSILFFVMAVSAVHAQTAQPYEYADATVTKTNPPVQVVLRSGIHTGKTISIDTVFSPNPSGETYKVGEKVLVSFTKATGGDHVSIIDYDRKQALLILAVIFIALVVLVTRWQGVASFIGMGFSFYIVVNMIIPQIVQGVNPVFISILGTALMIPVMFLLAHGINKKTVSAITGTLLSLLVTGLLAALFIDIAHLTGFASEEAVFIQSFNSDITMIRHLLLAGIIIGTLGILDDVTISQTAVVEKLVEANPKYSVRQLFVRSMDVGRDHIASLVNTLVLVYAGASLPLFVLFQNQKMAFSPIINHEIIATEIVRTLVASIGLVLAVPLTTLIAVVFIKQK